MIKQVSLTLSIGSIGGLLAYLAGFPAPFLTGSSIAVTIGGLLGLSLHIPALIRNICFIGIGLSMGAGVTPKVLETIGIWPLAFLILIASLLGTFFGGRFFLIRFWAMDRPSATLASSPGHLSFILGLSSQGKADVATISIIQSIRVMALTVAVPFAVSFMGLAGGDTSARTLLYMSLWDLALLVPMAALVGWTFIKLNFPAAFLLGGMLISTLTHASGLIEGQIPDWLTIFAFTIMGSLIGTRFSNVSMDQFRKAAGAGLLAVVWSGLMALGAGLVAAHLLNLPLAQLLIAFAPGGLEAMAAMAVIMDVDTTFVAAQHVFRLFFLSFLAPMMLAWDQKTK
ncbi:MAG: AbrB family transcriptional regulator [Cohaesibacter sp.]|nr:AbrB family transcriptional regulator [Cohaesibacter sp.]MCV6601117.1 AbrB family transcriptional regulator [Cohaesibacter sp.]